MKIGQIIHEEVVDLADARKKKRRADLMGKLSGVKDDLARHNQIEQQGKDALEQFRTQMEEQRKSARVPGFENFNDLTYYLVVDLNLPSSQSTTEKWKRWYGQLEPRDQQIIQMVAQHAPRILALLAKQRDQIEAFDQEWKQPFRDKKIFSPLDIYQAIRYIQHELKGDMETFAALSNLNKFL